MKLKISKRLLVFKSEDAEVKNKELNIIEPKQIIVKEKIIYRDKGNSSEQDMILMGLNEEQREKQKGMNDTTIYKLMGNSICILVLKAIFLEFFKEYLKENNQEAS